METQTSSTSQRPHRHGIFWPVLLIAIGVVLILVNLNLIEGDGWGLLFQFWPAIFIISGLDELYKREGFAGAVLMIGLGGVLLLANLGYLPMTALELLFRLWPVFLIALGLDILFRGSPLWVSILGGLAAIVIVAGVYWYAGNGPTTAVMNSEPIEQALGNATRAQVQIEPGIADLRLKAGEPGGRNLLAGEADLFQNQRLDDHYSVSNGTASYRLSSGGNDIVVPFFPSGDNYRWDLTASPDVPLELQIELGVGRQTLDLSGLEVTQFTSQTGVGIVDITLPANGDFEGRIKGGVGVMTVRVPKDAEVVIQLDSGITAVSYPDRFERDGDSIHTSGAGDESALVLFVEQPIGSVRIVDR